jgi:hypothetical protein
MMNQATKKFQRKTGQAPNSFTNESSGFPASFQLMHQEAYLVNSTLLSGFDHLLKGHRTGKYKGAYYVAFFLLSIALERLMKIILSTNNLRENNFSKMPEDALKKYGHDISKLYNELIKSADAEAVTSKLQHKIIKFFTYFANAVEGRYHNFKNIPISRVGETFEEWSEIIEIIKSDYLSKRTIENIKKKSWSKEYGERLLAEKANAHIVWEILLILKPLIKYLYRLDDRNYAGIPKYSEIFIFINRNKTESIRLKNWSKTFGCH